ncbi:MAG TPA: EamA family transporter [Gemmatales bacterium]|nr:EamA family transporter [Gemmatales bacterium]
MSQPVPAPGGSPFTGRVIFAFAVLYISWSTTYVAIKIGVRHFPPLLFGGTRIALAGLILLAILHWRGHRLGVSWRQLRNLVITGGLFFLTGNGLLIVAEQTVDSGLTAALISPTPLLLALIESLLPRGDRLTPRGWGGLILGLIGAIALAAPGMSSWEQIHRDPGVLLLLGSSLSWAVGSSVARHADMPRSPFLSAGYQMLLGGLGASLAGCLFGEVGQLHFTAEVWPGVWAYLYLLVVGSLLGFVAYIYLLANVSAALASTYSYVNPALALVFGALLLDEIITGTMIGAMVLILVGVALVKMGGVQPKIVEKSDDEAAE